MMGIDLVDRRRSRTITALCDANVSRLRSGLLSFVSNTSNRFVIKRGSRSRVLPPLTAPTNDGTRPHQSGRAVCTRLTYAPAMSLDKNLFTLQFTPSPDDPNVIDLVDPSGVVHYRKQRVPGATYEINVYGGPVRSPAQYGYPHPSPF